MAKKKEKTLEKTLNIFKKEIRNLKNEIKLKKKYEEIIFWKGVGIGVLGGIFGNIWVHAFVEFIKDFKNPPKIVSFLVLTGLLIYLINWFIEQIKKIR